MRSRPTRLPSTGNTLFFLISCFFHALECRLNIWGCLVDCAGWCVVQKMTLTSVAMNILDLMDWSQLLVYPMILVAELENMIWFHYICIWNFSFCGYMMKDNIKFDSCRGLFCVVSLHVWIEELTAFLLLQWIKYEDNTWETQIALKEPGQTGATILKAAGKLSSGLMSILDLYREEVTYILGFQGINWLTSYFDSLTLPSTWVTSFKFYTCFEGQENIPYTLKRKPKKLSNEIEEIFNILAFVWARRSKDCFRLVW